MKPFILEKQKFPGAVAIIIRHAERLPIHKANDAFTACLTSKGKNDAFTFGQIMSHISPVTLYHSPVFRCQQTAEWISAGMISVNQKATVIEEISNLGGPYITGRWEEIANLLERYGQPSFVRKWFNDEFHSDFIMPLEKAAKTQLKILSHQLNSHDSSTINITHDWNIMILREYYFNLRHEDIGEPDYLDGLYAYLHHNELLLVCEGHEKSIDPLLLH